MATYYNFIQVASQTIILNPLKEEERNMSGYNTCWLLLGKLIQMN